MKLLKCEQEVHISFCADDTAATLYCNAALCSRRKKHFIFDSINTITAPSFR